MLCKQMRPVTGENVYVELLTDGAEHHDELRAGRARDTADAHFPAAFGFADAVHADNAQTDE